MTVMYSIKHKLYMFRIGQKKKKKNRTEPIDKTKILHFSHTHIPTTKTHTHACTGGITKKGLIIN